MKGGPNESKIKKGDSNSDVYSIQQVSIDAMKYLGVVISSDGSMDKEVGARIGNATRVIGGMNEMHSVDRGGKN